MNDFWLVFMFGYEVSSVEWDKSSPHLPCETLADKLKEMLFRFSLPYFSERNWNVKTRGKCAYAGKNLLTQCVHTLNWQIFIFVFQQLFNCLSSKFLPTCVRFFVCFFFYFLFYIASQAHFECYLSGNYINYS